MSKIKFELEIDLTDSKSVLALSNFLSVVGGGEKATVTEVKQEPKQEAKAAELPKKEKPVAKQEPAKEVAKEVAKQEEPAKEEKTEEAPKKEASSDGISIVEVRALLAKKVGDYRTEIKNELTKLGASSVTTLEADKYQEFADFLNSLG